MEISVVHNVEVNNLGNTSVPPPMKLIADGTIEMEYKWFVSCHLQVTHVRDDAKAVLVVKQNQLEQILG